MVMSSVNPGEYVKIQHVIFGESFQFGSYALEVITIPPALCAASDSAIQAGWVPRMVQLSDGTRMLWLFEMDTLVKWLGWSGDE